MGRKPCCEKVGLKKGQWTAEEDKKLINFILTNGQCCWRAVPKLAGLLRCGKSCRLRWINYLRPDLKRGLLSESEENLVIELHSRLGNRWSKIASNLPGRTDNEIKNHWNTHIKKKLRKMGIDPLTHKPFPPSEEAEDHHHKHQERHHDVLVAIEEPLLLLTQKPEAGEDSLDADAFFSESPGFSTDEVPMIQPNEILVPCASSTASSSSTSPTPGSSSFSSFSSSSSTVRTAEMQLASMEWPLESMNMWGLDEFNGWDMMCDDGPETLGFEGCFI